MRPRSGPLAPGVLRTPGQRGQGAVRNLSGQGGQQESRESAQSAPAVRTGCPDRSGADASGQAALDRACARATARERVLAAMAELGPDELVLLAEDAEWLVASRPAAGAEELLEPRRCSWTGRGQRGRIRCRLELGHDGEHVWRAGEVLCDGLTTGIGGRRRCDLPAGHDGSCQWGRP